MPPLVAAASDQTGRTITMLSVGLVAVAIGLTVLTIWYWRFTSPKRRAAAFEPAEVQRSTAEDRQANSEEQANVAPSPAEASPFEPVEPVSGPVPEAEPAPVAEGSAMGLDSEQWAMLTQAVMDEYLDS